MNRAQTLYFIWHVIDFTPNHWCNTFIFLIFAVNGQPNLNVFQHSNDFDPWTSWGLWLYPLHQSSYLLLQKTEFIMGLVHSASTRIYIILLLSNFISCVYVFLINIKYYILQIEYYFSNYRPENTWVDSNYAWKFFFLRSPTAENITFWHKWNRNPDFFWYIFYTVQEKCFAHFTKFLKVN